MIVLVTDAVLLSLCYFRFVAFLCHALFCKTSWQEKTNKVELELGFRQNILSLSFYLIHVGSSSRPRPCLGENKPSSLTGGKFKISNVANLNALNKNTAFWVFGYSSSRPTAGQLSLSSLSSLLLRSPPVLLLNHVQSPCLSWAASAYCRGALVTAPVLSPVSVALALAAPTVTCWLPLSSVHKLPSHEPATACDEEISPSRDFSLQSLKVQFDQPISVRFG